MKNTTTVYYFPFLLLLLFLNFQSFSHKIDNDIICLKEKLDQAHKDSPDSIYKIIEAGIDLALCKNDSSNLAYFYFQKGKLYRGTSHKTALEYYFKAREVYRAINNDKRVHIVNVHLALINSLNLDQRKDLLERAIEFFHEKKDTFSLMMAYSYSALADKYGHQEKDKKDSILYYFKKPIDLALRTGDTAAQVGMYNNLGVISLRLKDYPSALYYYRKSLKMAIESGEIKDNIFHVRINLMSYYFETNNLDSALHYYSLIKSNSDRFPQGKEKYYRQLSEYYERAGNTDKALTYYKKSDSLKNILIQERDASALSLLELEYESKIKKQEIFSLNNEIKRAGYVRSLLIGIVFLTLLFSGIIIWQQKVKSRKKRELLKSERRFLESELQNSELKRQVLNDELKYTNKELTSFATNIVQNQNIIDEITERISLISKGKDIKSIQDEVRDLQVMLLQVFNNNAHRKEFVKRSKQLNHKLIRYLKSTFPQLNEGDINILILASLNLTCKEISVLYNVEEKSITQRRWRIRKKLPIEGGETFEDFFNRIMPDTDVRKIIY